MRNRRDSFFVEDENGDVKSDRNKDEDTQMGEIYSYTLVSVVKM